MRVLHTNVEPLAKMVQETNRRPISSRNAVKLGGYCFFLCMGINYYTVGGTSCFPEEDYLRVLLYIWLDTILRSIDLFNRVPLRFGLVLLQVAYTKTGGKTIRLRG